MLDGLKRLCEQAISKQLSVENLTYTFELSENFSAHLLGRLCAIYALENYEVRLWAKCKLAPRQFTVGIAVQALSGPCTQRAAKGLHEQGRPMPIGQANMKLLHNTRHVLMCTGWVKL